MSHPFADYTDEEREELRLMLKRLDGPMPLFILLSPTEQDDILHGRCVYRQHEGVPILDYTVGS